VAMKIRIRSTIHIPEIPAEVEFEQGTLRSLLESILVKTHFARELIDPVTGEIGFEGVVEARLNNVLYHALPAGLDTELHDGDVITLSLIMLGGG
jgi:hypothetical protein